MLAAWSSSPSFRLPDSSGFQPTAPRDRVRPRMDRRRDERRHQRISFHTHVESVTLGRRSRSTHAYDSPPHDCASYNAECRRSQRPAQRRLPNRSAKRRDDATAISQSRAFPFEREHDPTLGNNGRHPRSPARLKVRCGQLSSRHRKSRRRGSRTPAARTRGQLDGALLGARTTATARA